MALLRDIPRWLTRNARPFGSINMLQGVQAFARPRAPMGLRQFPLTGGEGGLEPATASEPPIQGESQAACCSGRLGTSESSATAMGTGIPDSMATTLSLTASAIRAP